MSHLGENVAALVDGQLSPVATERAHVHLAGCRGCRDLVEAERLMKARLTQLPAPAPGAELVGRLLALGGPSGPLPPRPGHVPGSPRPVPVALRSVGGAGGRSRPSAGRPPTYSQALNRPAGRPGAPRARRARLTGAVLGALGVVGAGVTGLVLAGPQAQTVPAQASFGSSVPGSSVPGSSVPGSSVPGSSVSGRSSVPVDVSLELGRNSLVVVRTAQRPDAGR